MRVVPLSASGPVACWGVIVVSRASRSADSSEPSLRGAQLSVGQQTEPLREGQQSTQRVVLTEQQPELRPRCEEPVGLIHAAGHQVINEHADVRVVSAEDHRLGPPDPAHSIDARDHTLSRCFLVTRGAVDLAGEEQMLDGLHLEPRRELGRRIVVVLDRVPRARHPRALEAGDCMQELELDGDREGSGEPVDVQLTRVESLGLQEDLVTLGGWELHDGTWRGRSIRSCTEKRYSSLSPSCRSTWLQFTERPSTRGGVPVLKRATVSPIVSITCAISTEG